MFIRSIAAASWHLPRRLRRASLVAGLMLLMTPAAAQAAASLSVTPAGQSVGGTVTLSGSGFAPSSPVTFTFDGTPLTTSTAMTDGSGNLSGVTFTVPAGSSVGAHTVSATDGSADTASTPLTVDSVSVTPSSGVAGQALTVSGAGWPASDQVDVQIDGQVVCVLTADSGGNISGTQAGNGCQVPSGPKAGTHGLLATDLSNGSQAIGATFLIPLAASFAAPSPAETGQVTFDASGSTVAAGSITNYSWNFGDGQTLSATSPTTTHTYSNAGSYLVTLVVSDSSGDVAQTTQQIQVEGPPVAQFVTSPAGATPTGTLIQFDPSSSTDPNGTITGYHWDFGDGQTSTLSTPTHAYATAGPYAVTLTVTDSAGTTNTIQRTITITDRPPTAAFNPTAATVLAGSNIAFDGSQSNDPDGTITGYAWKFGDGGSSTASQPSHVYLTAGTFTVTLTVTDNSGNTSSVTHQITVIAPPPTQTLILTPVASPTILKWARVSATHSGVINLGERLFCPGPGPGCTAFILATSRALLQGPHSARFHRRAIAGSAAISIAPNGSAEVTFKLSKRAFGLLRKRHRLPVHVKIVVVRGTLTTTRNLSLIFVG